MSKELELLEYLEKYLFNEWKQNHVNFGCDYDLEVELDKQLNNLKSVKEALQRLEAIDNANPSEALKKLDKVNNYLNDVYDYKEIKEEIQKDIDTIKQTLLKAQEQEKLIVELCEYCGMDNLYPYDNLNEIEITFKDTFDNYQRQRIESLGRLNKQEKVLDIIKEKNVDIIELKNCNTLEKYISHNVFNVYSQLTQEEFELLKRWLKKDRSM